MGDCSVYGFSNNWFYLKENYPNKKCISPHTQTQKATNKTTLIGLQLYKICYISTINFLTGDFRWTRMFRIIIFLLHKRVPYLGFMLYYKPLLILLSCKLLTSFWNSVFLFWFILSYRSPYSPLPLSLTGTFGISIDKFSDQHRTVISHILIAAQFLSLVNGKKM